LRWKKGFSRVKKKKESKKKKKREEGEEKRRREGGGGLQHSANIGKRRNRETSGKKRRGKHKMVEGDVS